MTKQLKVYNPFSGEALGEVSVPSDAEVSAALSKSQQAFEIWRKTSAYERSALLEAVAFDLEASRTGFARLISEEAGKPLKLADTEVDRALGVLRWAASESLRWGGQVLRLDTAKSGRPGWGMVTRFPRGVILGITPFNFPLNLVVHKVAPALASGNTIVIKPSPVTPLTAQRFAALFEKYSKNLVTVLAATDVQTAAMTTAQEIAMVSFTGSARVGWLVRAQASRKPVALELGGNAWCVVAEDVDASQLPTIAKRIVTGGYAYAGQSCISVQNVAIHNKHWDALRALLFELTAQMAYGDPFGEGVMCGPLINEAAKNRVEAEVQKNRGAALVQSKKYVGETQSALVMAPTLVESPALTSSLVTEEIFGPVVNIHRFHKWNEALSLVNGGRYGLQVGLFSQDLRTIESAYQECHVGGVIINDVPTTRYDHQPYGGVKDSGLGREGVTAAMEEMTEPKFLALSSVMPS